jgi:hypothetical protein
MKNPVKKSSARKVGYEYGLKIARNVRSQLYALDNRASNEKPIGTGRQHLLHEPLTVVWLIGQINLLRHRTVEFELFDPVRYGEQ